MKLSLYKLNKLEFKHPNDIVIKSVNELSQQSRRSHCQPGVHVITNQISKANHKQC